MFREQPVSRAISEIETTSDLRSRRISAQSSTISTCFLPARLRRGSRRSWSISVAVDKTDAGAGELVEVLVVRCKGTGRGRRQLLRVLHLPANLNQFVPGHLTRKCGHRHADDYRTTRAITVALGMLRVWLRVLQLDRLLLAVGGGRLRVRSGG
jgi:hypothetical protein